MKGVSDMKKIIISLVFSVLMTVAGFAQGGTGKFITAFSIDGHSKYHSSSNICFVRDGMDDRFEWRPYGIQDGDSIPNGVFMDIKDVKSIFRHVESDNQLIVNLPEGAPIAKEDISVIAYGKEIKPSRDNHYVTGANTVSVLDKNGRIIYECYISLDTLNAQRSINVDAMEMAYCLLIPLFPFALDPASDEILSTLKSLLAELSETHMLASAIDNSIVKNGYFEIEDVNAELEAAIERIIVKLGLRDNYLKQSSKSIKPKMANGSTEWGNNLPKLQDGESIYGLKLILDNSEWHAVGDKKWWQCFFTAYNSNRFAYTGWTKGYKDSEGYAHLYDIDYNLLKNRILKPQRVSTFMKTLTTWEGIKNYVSDTYDLFFTEGFGFDDMTWDYTKKSFDMNFNYTNEIVVVLGPADDDTMLLYNLIRTFLDPLLKMVGKEITKDDDYLMSFIVDLITDTNYMYEFHEIMKKNDSFGVNAREFVKLTWPKAKKHLGDYFGDYFKDELETKQLQYVWDKYGFMAAGDLQKTFKVIDENFNIWLKKVEFWGDMFLGNIGLFEGNHYYNLDLNFNYEQANVSKESFTVNGVKFDMVRVPGGSYQMGATGNDKDASSNEKPRHEVSVNNFYIGETEVTQGLWKAVMGSNPSHFNGTELPVENVSWLDCKDFVSRLNELTGKNFRLPTEAEWEYAARGGQNSLGYKYAGSHDINTVGWYKGNSENGTHPVRWKQANELGLYDMSGNVFEWCQDFYDATYYDNSPINDPCNDNVAALYTHVLRGGCWHWDEKYCRVSSRSSNGQNVKSEIFGLRLALSDYSELIVLALSTDKVEVETGKSATVEITSGSGSYEIFSNSAPNVADATLSGNTITITAKTAGTTTITIKDKGTGQTADISVTVTQKESTSLTLSTYSVELNTGNSTTVQITSGNGGYTVSVDKPSIATATISGTKITITGVAAGTAKVTVKDNSGQIAYINVTVSSSTGDCPVAEVIDLGLPSGTLWASWNVGASRPEEYGNYYAWGETEEKSIYTPVTYQYATGEDNDGDGYYDDWQGSSYGEWQNLGDDIAGTDYDIAHVKWGGNWNMPSSKQIQELIDNTISEWTQVNGVYGRRFTSIVPGNSNSIFLPASGYRINGEIRDTGNSGRYWSSKDYRSFPREAYDLFFSTNNVYKDNHYRCNGMSVRPVISPEVSLEAIDLGLPSGTKWANMNVGADKPEEIGNIYAWGETESKDNFSWSNYSLCDGSEESCYNIGEDISLTKYDVAHLILKDNWGMPSKEEIQELVDYCDKELTVENGVHGWRFYNKHNDENSIFIPFIDYVEDRGFDAMGRLWTSTIDSLDNSKAYALNLDYWEWDVGPFILSPSEYIYVYSEKRDSGMCVRPVYSLYRITPTTIDFGTVPIDSIKEQKIFIKNTSDDIQTFQIKFNQLNSYNTDNINYFKLNDDSLFSLMPGEEKSLSILCYGLPYKKSRSCEITIKTNSQMSTVRLQGYGGDKWYGTNAYTVLDETNNCLTFYYDDNRDYWDGLGMRTFDLIIDASKKEFIDRGDVNYAYYADSEKIKFDSSFANANPTTTYEWFYRLPIKEIEGLQYLNTSNVTDMSRMFAESSITTIDLKGLVTSNVTDMSEMFSECKSLTNLDLSGFNTSNVTDMNNMFYECYSLTSLDLSNFNTSNVTNMHSMFYLNPYANRTSPLVRLDLSNFNTSNVTDMGEMFRGASSLVYLDLSSFNTSNVTDMNNMFEDCSSLTNLDLSHFNTSNVTKMQRMFSGCSSLTSLDLSRFSTSNVTDMRRMLRNCSLLKTVYVGNGWTTDKVETSVDMFIDCFHIKGGNGTEYDSNHIDKEYARIDERPNRPGYFSAGH